MIFPEVKCPEITMTETQNPKQKNNRFEPVWNLEFGV
jgi:hypothetical protein